MANTADHDSDPFQVESVINETTPLLTQHTSSQVASDDSKSDSSQRKSEILGLILMTLSALGFSSMSLFVKLSGSNFPSFEIVFARSLIQMVLGLVGCALLKVNPLGKPGVRGWLVFRSLAGSIGLSLFFYSITRLPLADATVVFFLGPTFTAILAAVVLGEPFSLLDGLCAAFCMLGVILVSKPHFLFGGSTGGDPSDQTTELERVFAILCALMGAAMSAVAYVTVRKIGSGAHFMVHVVYFGALSIVISIPGIWLLQEFVVPHGWGDYGLLLLVGVCAFIGQCLLNQGLQLAPAGPGTLMRMNDVVFAFLFGIFILHEYPDAYSVVGAMIIMVMTTALGLRKWYSRRTNTA